MNLIRVFHYSYLADKNNLHGGLILNETILAELSEALAKPINSPLPLHFSIFYRKRIINYNDIKRTMKQIRICGYPHEIRQPKLQIWNKSGPNMLPHPYTRKKGSKPYLMSLKMNNNNIL